MSAPKRIQRRRTKGWRKPEDAIVVSRPGRWGNPISLLDVAAQFPSVNDEGIARMVVRDFAHLAKVGHLELPNWRYASGQRGPIAFTYPSVAEILAQLVGLDLACWCALDQPCHADVLLEIANGPS